MHPIRSYFEQFVTVTDADWQFFESKLEPVHVAAKFEFLKKGDTEWYLTFIETGVVRFFIPDEERDDLTFGFAFGPSFMSGYDSFLTQTPASYSIQSITPVYGWRIHYSNLQAIYQHTHIGNTIGRLSSEDLYIKKSRRELSLLQQTAQARYLQLMKEQPHILQQIPLKYIASYIGVTPQALSRIRRRIY